MCCNLSDKKEPNVMVMLLYRFCDCVCMLDCMKKVWPISYESSITRNQFAYETNRIHKKTKLFVYVIYLVGL